jgi:para-nitrobenzyl esterase
MNEAEKPTSASRRRVLASAVAFLSLLAILLLTLWWSVTPTFVEVTSTTDYLLDWPSRKSVKTRMGDITGLSNEKSLAFLGIPYAMSPEDEGRFKAPQSAQPWTDNLDATTFPNICIQNPPPALLGDLNNVQQSEDCLFLNIFSPSVQGASRPVLVWIHGGSFTGGSANDYDGSVLAEQGDVVVVTINYRLGVLGFLDLSSLGEKFRGSGSNGIRDQIQALKWVRDNIADYGGDSGNVTIFGESAGGQSVMAIMASPSADGLYHKAIEHSGGEVHLALRDATESLTDYFSVGREALVDLLQNASTQTLLEVQGGLEWGGGGRIDGHVVTRSISEAIIERGQQGVPLIAGSNRDEGTLFSMIIPWFMYGPIGEAVAENIDKRIDGKEYVNALKMAYPEDSRTETFERIWKDLLVRGGINAAVQASAAGVGGWLYRFDLPVQRLPDAGATHAAEIAFTFNQFVRDLPPTAYWYDAKGPIVRKLALDWSNTVIMFAKTGNPNGAGLPLWPRYTAETRQTMVLDNNPRVVSNLHKKDIDRWENAN